jgi:hypothetical protein
VRACWKVADLGRECGSTCKLRIRQQIEKPLRRTGYFVPNSSRWKVHRTLALCLSKVEIVETDQ